MNQHTLQADHLADQGSEFAVMLWEALSKIPLMNRKDTFETAVQVIAQGVRGRERANLVEASAMLALIDRFPERKRTIANEADDAHDEYVRLLRAEQAEDAADHYRELERDAQLLGDAA